MSQHKEINFENEICDYLSQHGWLYKEGDQAHYDRARALFPPDVVNWVQGTQPEAWEHLTKNHGTGAGETALERLRDHLNQRGPLSAAHRPAPRTPHHADLRRQGQDQYL